ncbi:hypothetical protein SAMN02910369_02308 [Lachnospiraceae bacterium NE2001]|nr:hypothetical protein SAMN02910369_02308 [Lachnospiraceae bacterium NE2001]
MEIFLNDNDKENIKIEVKGYDENVEEPQDLLLNLSAAIATIVGEMVYQIVKNASFDEKRQFANGILDFSKEIVSEFYESLKEDHDRVKKEGELYKSMTEAYDEAIQNYGFDEDEIIKLAQTVEPEFEVRENDGAYSCIIVFGDKSYTLAKIPVGLSDRYYDPISFKASMVATVLFDKAFPDDESKNPIRSKKLFNVFQDLKEDI